MIFIANKDNRKLKRVLLIYPPWASLMEQSYDEIPLGLCYLAGYIKQFGYEPIVYNADFLVSMHTFRHLETWNNYELYLRNVKNLSGAIWQQIRKRIELIKPDVVGIHTKTPSYLSALNVARIVREVNPNIPIIVGGVHASSVPLEVAKADCFDFVVRGEGERVLHELLECLNADDNPQKVKGLYFRDNVINKEKSINLIDGNWQIVSTGPMPFIDDLDSIPFPDKDSLLDRELYSSRAFGNIITSRGCPFHCTYCDSHQVWTRRVRYRSPSNVIDEIKLVYSRYGTKSIIFNDDSFTLDKDRTKRICELLIREKLDGLDWSCYTRANLIDKNLAQDMKKAGCSQVFIGLESGSPRILKMIKKGETIEEIKRGIKICNDAGLRVVVFVMIGFPSEVKEEIFQTIRIAKQMKPYNILPNILTPHPGTEIYQDLVSMGKISFKGNWEDFYHYSPMMGFSEGISKKEFNSIVKKVFRIAAHYNGISRLYYILHQITTNFRMYMMRIYNLVCKDHLSEYERWKLIIKQILKDIMCKLT